MTDLAAEIPADELERIRNYLSVWPVTVGMETPEGVPLAKQLLSHVDALSARLKRAEKALAEIEAKPYRAEEVIARFRDTDG